MAVPLSRWGCVQRPRLELSALADVGACAKVVNGLLQRPEAERRGVPVGILPGGSGNSVMLDLGTWSMAEVRVLFRLGGSCFHSY